MTQTAKTVTLFDPIRIGDIELKNRIIMAPMTRARADDEGIIADYTALYYRQRAEAGLIITEGVFPSAMGKGYVHTPGIHTDAQVAAWQKVTQAVHDAGGKIFAQIMFTGRISLPEFLPGNAMPVAPSAIAAKGETFAGTGMKPFCHAPRSGNRRNPRHHCRVQAGDGAGVRGRVRWRGTSRRVRVSADAVPLIGNQPADRSVRRKCGKPRSLRAGNPESHGERTGREPRGHQNFAGNAFQRHQRRRSAGNVHASGQGHFAAWPGLSARQQEFGHRLSCSAPPPVCRAVLRGQRI